jgi:hypothetical protein
VSETRGLAVAIDTTGIGWLSVLVKFAALAGLTTVIFVLLFGQDEPSVPDAGRSLGSAVRNCVLPTVDVRPAVGHLAASVSVAREACCKDDLTRFCQTTHPPGIAGRVANDLAVRVGDNNTGRDPDTNGEIRRNFRAAHSLRKSEPGVYCPLRCVFLGDRMTEVGKYFAPNALPYDPAELGDDGTGSSAVCIDNCLQFLGVRSQVAADGARRSKRSAPGS